jgi:multidrug efflux pump subunit AcrB
MSGGATARGLAPHRFGWFDPKFEGFRDFYEKIIGIVLRAPVSVLFILTGIIVVRLFLYPLDFLFPAHGSGQFVVNVKLPSGTASA